MLQLSIATEFDREKKDEVFQAFTVSDETATVVLKELLYKLSYSDRADWIKRNATALPGYS